MSYIGDDCHSAYRNCPVFHRFRHPRQVVLDRWCRSGSDHERGHRDCLDRHCDPNSQFSGYTQLARPLQRHIDLRIHFFEWRSTHPATGPWHPQQMLE